MLTAILVLSLSIVTSVVAAVVAFVVSYIAIIIYAVAAGLSMTKKYDETIDNDYTV